MSWGLPDYTYWPTEYSNEHLHAHGTRTWKRHKELPVPTLWMQSFSVWMIYHLLKLLYWEHHHQNLMFQRTAVKTRWNGNARALDLEPRQGFRGLEHFDVTPMVAVIAVVCNDEAEKNVRFQRRRRANRPMQGATGSNHELYSLDKKLGASSKSFCCIQDFLSSAGESIGAVCWMRGAAHEVQSVWVLHTGSEPAQMRNIRPWLV